MSVMRKNNVQVSGVGTEAIVFAHGYGCDQGMWRHVAPAFAATHKVVLFDHVGSGRSDLAAYDARRYAALDQYALDLLDICDELDLTNVIFVGHSVAAMIGVIAAVRRPARFGRMVLVGPSPCYINDDHYVGGFTRADIDGLIDFLDDNQVGWSKAMAPAIMGNAERPALGEELEQSFCRVDPTVARQFARATFLSDTRPMLEQLRVPSLILQCANDAIAPAAVGQYLHAALANSTLVQMRATGHCPNLSAPDETIAAIKAYLG